MTMNKIITPQAAEKVKENGEVICYVSGTSMYPLLKQGKDIVIVKQTTNSLKQHDVVLYLRNNGQKPVLHRIIKIKPDGALIIRGDNTYKNEYDICREDIIGILVGFYKNGRYIDCEKSRGYAIYVFFMRVFYPVRFIWKRIFRPLLSKIKRFIKRHL